MTKQAHAPVVKVGDTIEFRAVTRSGCRKAKRKVVAVDDRGVAVKSFHGWSGFRVRWSEISDVTREV